MIAPLFSKDTPIKANHLAALSPSIRLKLRLANSFIAAQLGHTLFVI
jgi:hypothetical protein